MFVGFRILFVTTPRNVTTSVLPKGMRNNIFEALLYRFRISNILVDTVTETFGQVIYNFWTQN